MSMDLKAAELTKTSGSKNTKVPEWLKINGCSNPSLVDIIDGSYKGEGTHEGRPTYVNVDKNPSVMLYYWKGEVDWPETRARSVLGSEPQ